MGKDRLDRFLVDGNSYDWFLRNINGIQSIKLLDAKRIMTEILKAPSLKLKTVIFAPPVRGYKNLMTVGPASNLILSCHAQKLDTIEAKLQKLSVYNVELQRVAIVTEQRDATKQHELVVTVGNLNSSDLADSR